jgi:hypothetical protein
MNVFAFGNADKKGVYFDEENRRHLNSIRSAYSELASDLATKGRKEEARKVLQKVDKMMHEENFPYGMVSRGNMHNRYSLLMLEAAYTAEDKELIEKISNAVKKDLQQQIKYYSALPASQADLMDDEKRMAQSYLDGIERMKSIYNPAITVPGKLMAPNSGTK